jgi:hypothetical protein
VLGSELRRHCQPAVVVALLTGEAGKIAGADPSIRLDQILVAQQVAGDAVVVDANHEIVNSGGEVGQGDWSHHEARSARCHYVVEAAEGVPIIVGDCFPAVVLGQPMEDLLVTVVERCGATIRMRIQRQSG